MEEDIQTYSQTFAFRTANVFNIYKHSTWKKTFKTIYKLMFLTTNVFNIYNIVYGRRHSKLFTNCYVSYYKCL